MNEVQYVRSVIFASQEAISCDKNHADKSIIYINLHIIQTFWIWTAKGSYEGPWTPGLAKDLSRNTALILKN